MTNGDDILYIWSSTETAAVNCNHVGFIHSNDSFLNFFNLLHLWCTFRFQFSRGTTGAKITFGGRAVTGHPGGGLSVHFTKQAQRHSNSEEWIRKMSDPDGSSREPGERLKRMVCLPTKVQLIDSWKQTLPELLCELPFWVKQQS